MEEPCLSLLLNLQSSNNVPIGRNFNIALAQARHTEARLGDHREKTDRKSPPFYMGAKECQAGKRSRSPPLGSPGLSKDSSCSCNTPSAIPIPRARSAPCTCRSASDRQLATPSYIMANRTKSHKGATSSYKVTNRTKSYKGKEPHTLAVGGYLRPCVLPDRSQTPPQSTKNKQKWVWHHVGVGKRP